MAVRQILAMFFGLILTGALLAPAAHADQWNEMTKLTFNQPVTVPRMTLPEGMYWFVLNGGSDRNVVDIYSADWSHFYEAIDTIPVIRQHSTSRTEVTFAERPSTQPEAMLDWYYPGRTTGHEFLYKTPLEHQLARDQKQTVVIPPLNTRS